MDVSPIQVLLIFIVAFIAGIDQFSFLESLYQPIVTGFLVGLILGDVQTGLIVGGTYQLMTIGNMPVGGAQPPNAVIGGIMSPVMATADGYAANADSQGIARINYGAMAALGLFFGVIVTLFFLGGAAFGTQITSAIPTWLMNALSVAGGMMRFVGFAILLKVMASRELWGFFLMGFAAAIVFISIPELSGPALLLLALIGFGIAFWDYQLQTKVKDAAPAVAGGDFEDGI